jgi:hypothetical protein
MLALWGTRMSNALARAMMAVARNLVGGGDAKDGGLSVIFVGITHET